jgi:hypothetical protein
MQPVKTDFEEPINPIRAMNTEWQERVEQISFLRFAGLAWDAVLVFLFGLVAYLVLTDGYGLGFGAGLAGLFFTLGGLAVWALLLALFFRLVGRGAMLRTVSLILFMQRILRRLFGGPAKSGQ